MVKEMPLAEPAAKSYSPEVKVWEARLRVEAALAGGVTVGKRPTSSAAQSTNAQNRFIENHPTKISPFS